MTVKKPKNDIAWEILFQEESILENIERDGYFFISSERINQEREARLMTKFDHKAQLPQLFRDNNLSIQPTSRGGYIIGSFSSYFTFPEAKDLSSVQYVELPPHIETIIPKNISSESSVVICSYLSNMLEQILEEEVSFTVFGRMSTGTFDYQIDNTKTGQCHEIKVENSQCEIDGGFEGVSKFAIIEAKCQFVDDFIIRQLYYPYRLWEQKVEKEVVPIFLSFSNNIFTFYVFRFLNLNSYNSLCLESVHRYCIGQYEIELSDIRNIFNSINSFEEDDDSTFPQADIFARVIDLLDKLYIHGGFLSKEEITIDYAFDVRQTNYYVSAGIYLGFFEKLRSKAAYILSAKGREIMELDPKRKNLELVRNILSHKVFNLVLGEYFKNAEKPSREKIIAIMKTNLPKLNATTISRRARTVDSWIEWILQLTST